LGQSESIAHFGLGSQAALSRLSVFWPVTGARQVFEDVPANQVLVVEEPDGDARP
jgi:hypothetical protein